MTNSSSRIAFLFPGQGSQAVGMGRELSDNYPVARQTFEEADEALGYKLSELCFEGPEEKLKMTEITQPAILTATIAAWRVLQEKGLKPDLLADYVAGHSLGEYSAHVAAGTLTFADAVRTVRNRGKYMHIFNCPTTKRRYAAMSVRVDDFSKTGHVGTDLAQIDNGQSGKEAGQAGVFKALLNMLASSDAGDTPVSGFRNKPESSQVI